MLIDAVGVKEYVPEVIFGIVLGETFQNREGRSMLLRLMLGLIQQSINNSREEVVLQLQEKVLADVFR